MGRRSLIEQDGWRLWVAEYTASTPGLLATALALADGNGKGRQAGGPDPAQLLRRSRHAATYQVQSNLGDPQADLFVKCFDPPKRLERLKACLRGSRARRAERITASLTSAGFSAPGILLRGTHHESRRELLVTARAEGDGPLMTLNRLNGSIAAKRALLCALG